MCAIGDAKLGAHRQRRRTKWSAILTTSGSGTVRSGRTSY
jgi:hypothetical protein